MERSPSPRDDPDPEPPERQLRVLTWGLVPVVGQGPVDRQPDDQRPDGDGGREAGVQAGLRVAAVPAPGRRLLRVVPHPADREVRASRSSSPSSSIRRTAGVLAMAGLYEIWRDPDRAEDDPDRFRWTCTVLTTAGGGRRRSHPRPDAADGRARPVGRLARPGRLRRATTCCPCWCRPRPGASRRSRSRPTSTTSATTGRRSSSRSRPRTRSRERAVTPTLPVADAVRRGAAGRARRPRPDRDAAPEPRRGQRHRGA